ncbi:MAG: hypothetical protein HY749_24035 [Gammaproteobacteria bacterium]|nr:hypothetical protein [Gammaproteobacteria bacterium]MBI5616008.1 hypothetical protein [Gammaproteobacteria bacterium]
MTEQETRVHASPEALMAYYAEACGLYGKVTGLKLFCHAEYPGDAFCMISLSGNMGAAASALSAHQAGTTLCRIVPLTSQFTCTNRNNGTLGAMSCSACQMHFGAD